MSTALIVLNPRQIPECIPAIRGLGLPTLWLSNMSEPVAAKEANRQISATHFDRYVLLSDDTIPSRRALNLILQAADDGHPAVTGYCNLDTDEHEHLVNLTSNQLPPPPPKASSYLLMTRDQAERQHGPLIPTTFAGLSLTLLTRDLWLEHPLTVSTNGGQMDYMLSHSLAQAGIPIVAPNGAFIHHVKERWNHMDANPSKRLLVGIRPPMARWTQPKVPA